MTSRPNHQARLSGNESSGFMSPGFGWGIFLRVLELSRIFKTEERFVAKSDVKHNEPEHRFEIPLGNQLAMLVYQLRGNDIALVHTEVPKGDRGRGVAGDLAEAALEYAKSRHQLVVPECRFVTTYLKRHPEYREIVKPEYRK